MGSNLEYILIPVSVLMLILSLGFVFYGVYVRNDANKEGGSNPVIEFWFGILPKLVVFMGLITLTLLIIFILR